MPKRVLATAQDADLITVTDVDVRYAGQWVLMEVTESDARRGPTAGRILEHGTKARVNKVLARIAATGIRPELPLYIFAAGAFLRSPEALEKELDAWRES